MSLIPPKGVVQIYRAVPLSPDLKHTVLFTSTNEAIDSLANYNAFQGSLYSYIRVSESVVRVQSVLSLSLLNANYMRFSSSEFADKVWFAFIDHIEYVNNNTIDVFFVIDPLLSFNYAIGQNFVVREHSVEDNPGDNLVTENLDLGDYIIAQQTRTNYTNSTSWAIVIAASTDGSTENTPVEGAIYNNIYSGVKYTAYLSVDAVNTELENYTKNGTSDSILGIFMVPLVDDTVPSFTVPIHRDVSIPKPTTINGYTPRNKKLLTYPFNAILINNQQGNVGVFRQEFFSGDSCKFSYDAMFSLQSEIAMTPVDYKGVTGNSYADRVSINSMPFCSYTIDAYRAYLAQSRSSLAVTALSTVSSGALSVLTGNTLGIVGTAGSVASLMARQEDYKRKAPQANGSPTADLLWALNAFDFLIQQQTITSGAAARIDSYFDAYGYQTNKVKTPNRTSRPHWNYVQTRDCLIAGPVPSKYHAQIQQAYDNGITFWKSLPEVGNYNQDNSPQ